MNRENVDTETPHTDAKVMFVEELRKVLPELMAVTVVGVGPKGVFQMHIGGHEDLCALLGAQDVAKAELLRIFNDAAPMREGFEKCLRMPRDAQ